MNYFRALFLGISLLTLGLYAETIDDVLAATESPRELIFKENGQRKLPLYVFSPSDLATNKPRAAMVVIHGGGWSGSEAAILFAHCRYLARRGMVTIAIEYRLTKEGGGIGDCLADSRDAVRWVVTHAQELGIDPKRLALMGESSGGHLAAGVALIADDQAPISVTALCLFDPVLDIGGLSWWKGLPGMKTEGVDPHDPQHLAQKLSPIAYVRGELPPTLIVHGTADATVPFAQAEQFTQKMHEAGNRCDLVPLAGVSHAFLLPGYGTPATIADGLIALDRFLADLGLLSGPPSLVAVPTTSTSAP
jgi:acetyl esterase